MAKKSLLESSSTSKFVEVLAEEGGKSLLQTALSLATKYGKKAIDRALVEIAIDNYSANYRRRFGEVKILAMAGPVPLEKIYTKIRLVNAYVETLDIDLTKYEKFFWSRRDRFEEKRSMDAFDVVGKHSRLNVLGAPGAGKSTLLKRIGLYLLENNGASMFNFETEFIPVLIELKRFEDINTVNIQAAIQNEFEIAGFPESNDFVVSALKDGKFVVLLDGLDEVPKLSLDKVIEAIRDFTHKYSKNRYITSCRTAFYKNYLTDYTDIMVADFDDNQIRTFINNWFSADQDLMTGTGDKLSTSLFENGNIATLELVRTPLLLAFLCMVYDSGQQFPANRSSLYRKALDILLEKWAAEKRIHHQEIYQNLNSDIEIQMLSEIAAEFYEKDRALFHGDELKDKIREYLENTMGLQLPPVSKILEAIEVQQGLIVQRTADIYSFSHLTIQEYLTAFYYYSPIRMQSLIEKHCFEAKWREVFVLQAGMSHSEDLLLLLSKYLQTYTRKHQLLRDGVEWANKIVKTDNSPHGVCTRVMLLSILIRYRLKVQDGFTTNLNPSGKATKDFINLFDPEFYDKLQLPDSAGKRGAPLVLEALGQLTGKKRKIQIAQKEIDALVPNRPLSEMAPGSRRMFNKKIIAIILKTFDAPESFMNPRMPQLMVIEKYIEALELLATCKQSALRVSPQVWSEVSGGIVR